MLQAFHRFFSIAFCCAVSIGCSGTEAPTDPGGSSGIIFGSVRVFDEHFKSVDDKSGITARYRDTEGRVFEAVTNADGVWEIEAPLGVYTLDTIVHPTMIQYHPGLDNVAENRPKISFIGVGNYRAVSGTEFCPSPLADTDELLFLSSTIDTTYVPADPDNGIPERHLVNLSVRAQRFTPFQNGDARARLILPNNSVVHLSVDKDQTADPTTSVLTAIVNGLEVPLRDVQRAKVEFSSWSIATQTYYAREGEDWVVEHREVPSDTTIAAYSMN